jgi:prepilin-type processing-associated H-X9-DG protein
MNELTSICEEIHFIPEDLAPNPNARASRRIPRWVVLAGTLGAAALFMTPVINSAVRESQRKHCETNLKRLGLAFHEYHEAHGHFPAPAIVRRDGTPLLSWRVALLPHLGYRSLYDRFHLDEPWDSPHNQRLIAETPPELACPGAAGRHDGETGYLVVVGPEINAWSVNTPFDSTRGVDLREITDGTSNTVLVMETDTLIPWTKPDDLHWSPAGALPQLRSPHNGGTHALFADGATRFITPAIRPEILRGMLTINGGEVIAGG